MHAGRCRIPRAALAAALLVSACGGVNGRALSPDDDPPGSNPFDATATIDVLVAVTGQSPVQAYTVSVSNGQKADLPPNGSMSFTTRRTGTHQVALTPVPASCSLAGPNPVDLDLGPWEHASVTFVLNCGGAQ